MKATRAGERTSPYMRSPERSRLMAICTLMILAIANLASPAQSPLTDSSARSLIKSSTVEFLSSGQIAIPVGKASPVELHFRIEEGFHINSHTPKDPALIPTAFSIPADSGVMLVGATYPVGADYTLAVDPTTKLSVYSGDFTIQARIKAAHGDHHVEASLHYQACDKNACYPPKTIAVPLDVAGR